MERKEIIETLTAIFADVFSEEGIELRDEMSAEDVENWDSLTNMMMIEEIQEKFGFRFKLKQLPTLTNVKNIVDAIESNLNV